MKNIRQRIVLYATVLVAISLMGSLAMGAPTPIEKMPPSAACNVVSHPSADTDGDGIPNNFERLVGSDPTDPHSHVDESAYQELRERCVERETLEPREL